MSVNSGELVPRPAKPESVVSGQIIEKRDGEWKPVEIAERGSGFTVKDRRRVR